MNRRLTWYRWEWPDPVHKDFWTACTVSVYEPTYDRPFVSVLISIANGGGRVLMRTLTLAEARRRVGIPDAALERLELAITRATERLVEIQRDLKVIADSRALAPGAMIVRTDTGEIIAEAESLLQEVKHV